MYIFILAVHIVVCLVLIFVVLLQAGRGGGFSEMVGGGQPQTIFGTQTNAFMVRATEICAVLFVVTSLSLGVLSSQKSKSLIGKNALPPETSSKAMPDAEKLSQEAKEAADAIQAEIEKSKNAAKAAAENASAQASSAAGAVQEGAAAVGAAATEAKASAADAVQQAASTVSQASADVTAAANKAAEAVAQ